MILSLFKKNCILDAYVQIIRISLNSCYTVLCYNKSPQFTGTALVYFDNMVSQIYHSELQLNKANTSNTEASFLDLLLTISNDTVSTKIEDNMMILILKLSIFYF